MALFAVPYACIIARRIDAASPLFYEVVVMKMHEPIGNLIYGPLVARLPLAAYFIMAGLYKLDVPAKFLGEVRTLGQAYLPEPMLTLYGILLPYVEIGAGGFLLVGIWTTFTSIILSLCLLSYIMALGFYSGMPFNKDLVLLGLSLSLLYTGPGAFSIDRFRKGG